jgi:outer membrane immunogenic protein
MKKILLASVAVIAFCAPAFAADMPVKSPYAPAFSWTGCYVGGNLGGGWAHDQWQNRGLGEPQAAPHSDGFVGGGQIGCDYQTGAWVFGVEGMFDWTDLKGSAIDPFALNVLEHDNFKWFGTITGRVGYAVDRTLFYAKGGAAWANAQHVLTGGTSGTLPQTARGWVVGGGVEWAFAPQWSVKIEYDHIDLNQKTGQFSPADSELFSFSGQRVDTVLVGLNYRFGTGGKAPVVAKY